MFSTPSLPTSKEDLGRPNGRPETRKICQIGSRCPVDLVNNLFMNVNRTDGPPAREREEHGNSTQQNRTKQNKTKQNKTSRAGQDQNLIVLYRAKERSISNMCFLLLQQKQIVLFVTFIFFFQEKNGMTHLPGNTRNVPRARVKRFLE